MLRTRRSLHEALNTLILEKGYEATTVGDIVARANVGRSTFYGHHGGKEDLLLSGLEHLQKTLLAWQREALAAADGSSERTLGFSRAFFEHVHEYRHLLQPLHRSEAGPAVTRRLKRVLTSVVRNELRPDRQAGPIPREAAARFAADALLSVLSWWFEQCPRLKPAEVNTIFRRLALPGFVAAGIS
ncbi:MAG TPA: TetR/AcrR family transcriptional regulator [Candidatus Didemnitutus sp.]|nr:TetR/AcrR family transcriptional regulator [Candidatus Didemnitutus sp.]